MDYYKLVLFNLLLKTNTHLTPFPFVIADDMQMATDDRGLLDTLLMNERGRAVIEDQRTALETIMASGTTSMLSDQNAVVMHVRKDPDTEDIEEDGGPTVSTAVVMAVQVRLLACSAVYQPQCFF